MQLTELNNIFARYNIVFECESCETLTHQQSSTDSHETFSLLSKKISKKKERDFYARYSHQNSNGSPRLIKSDRKKCTRRTGGTSLSNSSFSLNDDDTSAFNFSPIRRKSFLQAKPLTNLSKHDKLSYANTNTDVDIFATNKEQNIQISNFSLLNSENANNGANFYCNDVEQAGREIDDCLDMSLVSWRNVEIDADDYAQISEIFKLGEC